MKEIKFRRNGDVNLHEVKKTKGEVVKHNGSFVLAEGEATGSKHHIKVKNPDDLIIKKDEQGNMYFELLSEGILTHTHDHETTTILPGKYKQVGEREIDNFGSFIVRRVID